MQIILSSLLTNIIIVYQKEVHKSLDLLSFWRKARKSNILFESEEDVISLISLK